MLKKGFPFTQDLGVLPGEEKSRKVGELGTISLKLE